MADLNYWNRVGKLKPYSLECRCDCYTIYMLRKMFHQHFPRLRTQAMRPQHKSYRHYIITIWDYYFTSIGPVLSNITPKHIKEETGKFLKKSRIKLLHSDISP